MVINENIWLKFCMLSKETLQCCCHTDVKKCVEIKLFQVQRNDAINSCYSTVQSNNKPCQSPLFGRDKRVGKNVKLLA